MAVNEVTTRYSACMNDANGLCKGIDVLILFTDDADNNANTNSYAVSICTVFEEEIDISENPITKTQMDAAKAELDIDALKAEASADIAARQAVGTSTNTVLDYSTAPSS